MLDAFFKMAVFPTWSGHQEKAGFDRNDVPSTGVTSDSFKVVFYILSAGHFQTI